jgi:hypothetical protein
MMGMWGRYLRKALAESCVPRRNWRWMLSSFGIGAGFGLVAGLHRLGQEQARITQEVAMTTVRAAVTFFVVAWLVVVAIRFGRLLRADRRV